MNKQVQHLISTIKKIDFLKTTEEKVLSDDSISIRFEYKEESFFLITKIISEEYIVINSANPMSMNGIPPSRSKLEIANEFNSYTVGTKCLLIDNKKNHFIFVREEFIRLKDIFNKDLIEARIKLSLELITNAVDIFKNICNENDENVEI